MKLREWSTILMKTSKASSHDFIAKNQNYWSIFVLWCSFDHFLVFWAYLSIQISKWCDSCSMKKLFKGLQFSCFVQKLFSYLDRVIWLQKPAPKHQAGLQARHSLIWTLKKRLMTSTGHWARLDHEVAQKWYFQLK